MAGTRVTRSSGDSTGEGGVRRRRFLTYMVAAPFLTVAARYVMEPDVADAVVKSPPQLADTTDLGEIAIVLQKPTADMLVLEVMPDNKVRLELVRTETGQGITTAAAMIVADEMDVPLGWVEVPLSDSRPELLFNQITGGSLAMRSQYEPIRRAAAEARARTVAVAAQRWSVAVDDVYVQDGVLHGPDGQRATYGELSEAAAKAELPDLTVTLKQDSELTLTGRPVNRIDARDIVTGRQRYAMDLDVDGALPTMVRRPPTINGTVESVSNTADVRAMPGVIDVVTIPTGVAVVAETFGQALDGKNALDVTWGPGTLDDQSSDTIRDRLRDTVPAFPALPGLHLDAAFDFAFASHAPMETNNAVADVRADRAEIWVGTKTPIDVQQKLAEILDLPQEKVTVHVTQAGGSFGRRLFFDAAIEAALVSKAMRRPVKLMWSRIDDMRHARLRGASHHKLRATYALGEVLSYEQRVAHVRTDFGHGLGEMLTAAAADVPIGNMSFAQAMFSLGVKVPYNFGEVVEHLDEVDVGANTASWRSVYSANTRGAEEMFVDELAAKLGKDPVAFRREFLKTDRQRAVLDKVASAGAWGRSMPTGFAQGVGVHDEYKSCTACLVEIDARDPRAPRVTKAVIAADVGKPLNPRGIEAQLLGGLTDAISITLRAGLHIDKGLPLEGSYSQFHYARQKDSPRDVKIFVLPATGELGGVGELGVPAAVGAIGNAYARATGVRPRSFPVNFPVDFEPFPR